MTSFPQSLIPGTFNLSSSTLPLNWELIINDILVALRTGQLPSTWPTLKDLEHDPFFFKVLNATRKRPHSYLVGLDPYCSIPFFSKFGDTLFQKMNITIDWSFEFSSQVKGLKVTTPFGLPPLPILRQIPCIMYWDEDPYLTPSQAISNVQTQKTCIQASKGNTKLSTTMDLWGLDAIDGSKDSAYKYTSTGNGVNIYFLDSGIIANHAEFTNRAQLIYTSPTLTSTSGNTDCTGHGTHVAGIAAGHHVGVAKLANINMLRIIGCSTEGSVSDAVAALDFLNRDIRKPAVINLSLGPDSPLTGSTLPNVLSQLASNGIPIVIAAGNSAVDVCSNNSMNGFVSIPNTFVVGALNSNFESTRFSNYGSCVKFWAPGEQIWSASNQDASSSSPNAFESRMGTSQATPFVTGVLALILEKYPQATIQDLTDLLNEHVKKTNQGYLRVATPQFPNAPNYNLNFPLSTTCSSTSFFSTAIKNWPTLLVLSGVSLLLLVCSGCLLKKFFRQRRLKKEELQKPQQKIDQLSSSLPSAETIPNTAFPPSLSSSTASTTATTGDGIAVVDTSATTKTATTTTTTLLPLEPSFPNVESQSSLVEKSANSEKNLVLPGSFITTPLNTTNVAYLAEPKSSDSTLAIETNTTTVVPEATPTSTNHHLITAPTPTATMTKTAPLSATSKPTSATTIPTTIPMTTTIPTTTTTINTTTTITSTSSVEPTKKVLTLVPEATNFQDFTSTPTSSSTSTPSSNPTNSSTTITTSTNTTSKAPQNGVLSSTTALAKNQTQSHPLNASIGPTNATKSFIPSNALLSPNLYSNFFRPLSVVEDEEEWFYEVDPTTGDVHGKIPANFSEFVPEQEIEKEKEKEVRQEQEHTPLSKPTLNRDRSESLAPGSTPTTSNVLPPSSQPFPPSSSSLSLSSSSSFSSLQPTSLSSMNAMNTLNPIASQLSSSTSQLVHRLPHQVSTEDMILEITSKLVGLQSSTNASPQKGMNNNKNNK